MLSFVVLGAHNSHNIQCAVIAKASAIISILQGFIRGEESYT